MTKLLKNRVLALSFKVAGICVIATFLNTIYDGPGHGMLWYFQSKILLPALYIGVIISGNPHAPNAIVSYIALFVIYFIIVVVFIIFSRFFYRQAIRILGMK